MKLKEENAFNESSKNLPTKKSLLGGEKNLQILIEHTYFKGSSGTKTFYRIRSLNKKAFFRKIKKKTAKDF